MRRSDVGSHRPMASSVRQGTPPGDHRGRSNAHRGPCSSSELERARSPVQHVSIGSRDGDHEVIPGFGDRPDANVPWTWTNDGVMVQGRQLTTVSIVGADGQ